MEVFAPEPKNLTLAVIKGIFLNQSEKVKNQLMPLSPEHAWVKFEKEFKKAEKDLATYGHIKN